jgi:hypothetical protein
MVDLAGRVFPLVGAPRIRRHVHRPQQLRALGKDRVREDLRLTHRVQSRRRRRRLGEKVVQRNIEPKI